MNALSAPLNVSSLLSDRTPSVSGQTDKAAKEMEGLFMSLLLKEMRQTVDSENGFAGDPSDTIGGLFDQMMGDHLSANGGIGIADSMLGSLPKAPTLPSLG